jgi:hypothetical protein
MASESRNSRKKRRVKLNLSRARRALQEQTQRLVQTHATLLMVLSAMGGEIEVNQATMQTVLQGMRMLNWVTEAKTDCDGAVVPNKFIVRVVTQEGVQEVVDEAIEATDLATSAEVEAGFAAAEAANDAAV